MNKAASSYLDAIRFFAALVVFIGHLNFSHIGIILPLKISLSDFGNDAVMVFFVLSGFIIQYVKENKEKDIRSYISSRSARLLSVVWPALAITLACDLAGQHLFPEFYQNAWWIKTDHPLFRIAANSLLLNQIWLTEIRPLSNGPFWSLGYEAWFYAFFIPLAYLKNNKKIAILLIMLAVAGPRVIILFPIWIFGAKLYTTCKQSRCEIHIAALLSLLPLIGYAILRSHYAEGELTKLALGDYSAASEHFFARSSNFIENYLVATLVATHIYGTYKLLEFTKTQPKWITQTMRTCGSWTFALYATHYPIIHLIAASNMQHKSLALWLIPT